MLILETKLLATYKGKNLTVGFIPEHIYEITVKEEKRGGYMISSSFDTTFGYDFFVSRNYSSENSVLRDWEFTNTL